MEVCSYVEGAGKGLWKLPGKWRGTRNIGAPGKFPRARERKAGISKVPVVTLVVDSENADGQQDPAPSR